MAPAIARSPEPPRSLRARVESHPRRDPKIRPWQRRVVVIPNDDPYEQEPTIPLHCPTSTVWPRLLVTRSAGITA
jgi:hypothetical protein